MKFGDIYMGTGKQAGSNHQRWKGEFMYLHTFPVLTFMMERPDDGRIIVESEYGVFHEDKENLLPLNEDTLDALKAVLEKLCNNKLLVQKKRYEEAEVELSTANAQYIKTEEHVQALKALNEDVYSANRAMTIRQHGKALRKQERKVKALQMKMDELKTKMSVIQRNHLASVEYLELQLMELLKKQH